MAETCFNQSDFDYRREEGVNQSSLKKILESPAHYQAALKFKMIPTPAMEMGTALHCRVLDGATAFDRQYVKKPDGLSLATKEGKEWKAALGRKKVLAEGGKDDPWGSVQGMAESLRRLEWFSGTDAEYIKYNEVSIYWDWEGVRCKARLDRVLVDEGIVLDLKTTDSVEPDLFTKKVVGLGYDFQAAYYAKAAEVAFGKPFKFMFAAVERKAPYTVDIFDVSDAMMAEGMAKCTAALRLYKTCNDLGRWPNREPRIRSLEYPSWYTPYGQPTTEEEDLF
ncbi:exonuclease VIII [Synechococcus phage S-CBS2]|uniref:exonuclease VIII n=1 Tax=Synechococcus phage S-CBS2 TaxID=753084 RepID=UPI0002078421|nr:exonuclease VIII [Synechococcus phage S-CBS2]ADF42428.1 5'-3' exonuclease [Synechococcus phage S-CBS2]